MDITRLTSEFPGVSLRTLAEALEEMQQQRVPGKTSSSASL